MVITTGDLVRTGDVIGGVRTGGIAEADVDVGGDVVEAEETDLEIIRESHALSSRQEGEHQIRPIKSETDQLIKFSTLKQMQIW